MRFLFFCIILLSLTDCAFFNKKKKNNNANQAATAVNAALENESQNSDQFENLPPELREKVVRIANPQPNPESKEPHHGYALQLPSEAVLKDKLDETKLSTSIRQRISTEREDLERGAGPRLIAGPAMKLAERCNIRPVGATDLSQLWTNHYVLNLFNDTEVTGHDWWLEILDSLATTKNGHASYPSIAFHPDLRNRFGIAGRGIVEALNHPEVYDGIPLSYVSFRIMEGDDGALQGAINVVYEIDTAHEGIPFTGFFSFLYSIAIMPDHVNQFAADVLLMPKDKDEVGCYTQYLMMKYLRNAWIVRGEDNYTYALKKDIDTDRAWQRSSFTLVHTQALDLGVPSAPRGGIIAPTGWIFAELRPTEILYRDPDPQALTDHDALKRAELTEVYEKYLPMIKDDIEAKIGVQLLTQFRFDDPKAMLGKLRLSSPAKHVRIGTRNTLADRTAERTMQLIPLKVLSLAKTGCNVKIDGPPRYFFGVGDHLDNLARPRLVHIKGSNGQAVDNLDCTNQYVSAHTCTSCHTRSSFEQVDAEDPNKLQPAVEGFFYMGSRSIGDTGCNNSLGEARYGLYIAEYFARESQSEEFYNLLRNPDKPPTKTFKRTDSGADNLSLKPGVTNRRNGILDLFCF